MSTNGRAKDARERLARFGAEALTLEELLGLAGGSKAEALLQTMGGLTRLAGASPSEFRAAGMRAAGADAVCAAFELGRRVAQAEVPIGLEVHTAAAAFEYLRPRIGHLRHEVFVVLLLDIRLRIIRDVTVAKGNGWTCAVQPRDALLPALREGAAAVVFAHNHPSNDPTPSPEDRELTRRLVDAAELLGVRAVDHIVVAARSYASFQELGLWRPTGRWSAAAER